MSTRMLRWCGLTALLCFLQFATLPVAAQDGATRPDFSGIWQVDRRSSLATGAGREAMAPTDGSPIPFQPWNAALHQGYLNAQKAGQPWSPNNQRCLVAGTVRAMKGNFPWRWIQNDDQITLLFEEDGRVNIFPIRNEHPAGIKPTWTGDAIARWDGDTLVVHVIGFNGKTPFPHAFYHTTHLQVEHRFKLLPGGKQLEDRIRIEDPGAFTRPFEALSIFNRQPDSYKMIDYRCAENNRDMPEPIQWWGADWGPE